MANTIQELSLIVGEGATSQKVAVSAVSAASAAITGHSAVVYLTVDCFVRQGAAPVAVGDGTDQFLPAGQLFRLSVRTGNKFAFIAAANGFAYITPEA